VRKPLAGMAVDAGVYPIAILCKLAAQQLINHK
jgi:hypothetical protein